MKVDRIDEQAALEVVEGDVAHQMLDQGFERFTAIQCGGKKTAEGDIGPGYLEHVPAAYQSGSGLHLAGGDASRPGRRDQRADTGAYDQGGNQPPLFQGAEHPDMGQTLQPATAQYQGKRTVRYHWLAPTKVGSL
jgi:hypothetical protein